MYYLQCKIRRENGILFDSNSYICYVRPLSIGLIKEGVGVVLLVMSTTFIQGEFPLVFNPNFFLPTQNNLEPKKLIFVSKLTNCLAGKCQMRGFFIFKFFERGISG